MSDVPEVPQETEEKQEGDLVQILENLEPGAEVHINGGINPMSIQKMPGGYVLLMSVQVPVGISSDVESVIGMAVKLIANAPDCGCGCHSCEDGVCEV